MTKKVAPVVDERVARRSTDRRRARLPVLLYGAIVYRRRRRPRRHDDTRRYYVDWYDGRLFAAATGIFLFCCLDALFTIRLLEMGAEEINPFMAALLEHGVWTFLYTKLVVTGLGLVFLVVHAAFWVADAIRVSQILYVILGSYMTLVVYQLGMLGSVF